MKVRFLSILLFLSLNPLAFAKTYQINMLSSDGEETMLFKPDFLKINLGEEVIFKPTAPDHNSQSLLVPKGARKWEGEVGKEIKVKFTKEGFYLYECVAHSVMTMMGVVQVGKAANSKTTKAFLKKHKKEVAVNKKRIDRYLQKIK